MKSAQLLEMCTASLVSMIITDYYEQSVAYIKNKEVGASIYASEKRIDRSVRIS